MSGALDVGSPLRSRAIVFQLLDGYKFVEKPSGAAGRDGLWAHR